MNLKDFNEICLASAKIMSIDNILISLDWMQLSDDCMALSTAPLDLSPFCCSDFWVQISCSLFTFDKLPVSVSPLLPHLFLTYFTTESFHSVRLPVSLTVPALATIRLPCFSLFSPETDVAIPKIDLLNTIYKVHAFMDKLFGVYKS